MLALVYEFAALLKWLSHCADASALRPYHAICVRPGRRLHLWLHDCLLSRSFRARQL